MNYSSPVYDLDENFETVSLIDEENFDENDENLISFDEEEVARFESETKKWIAWLSFKFITYVFFLFSILYLYFNKDNCNKNSSFVDFTVVILFYIILQTGFDLFLATVSCCALQKTKKRKTLEFFKKIQPKKNMLYNFRDENPKAINDLISQGNRILKTNKILNLIGNFNVKNKKRVGVDKVKEGLYNLKRFSSSTKSSKLKESIKFSYPFKKYNANLFFLTVNALPIFTIIFYIMLGLKTADAFSDDKCPMMFILNWTVLSLILIQSFIRCIPFFIQLVKKSIEEGKNVGL